VDLPRPHPLLTPLRDLLSGKDDTVALDVAALGLASIEFPELDADESRQKLDHHAAAVAARLQPDAGGREFIATANEYLFGELGLRGNADDYYDPHNSCLNMVIDGHPGIPITLSVMYMEVARRLARPVRGIGLPGHFIVQYNDGEYSAYVDPFHEGAVLTDEACYQLAQASRPDPSLLAPFTPRQILTRMANNLRGIYFSQRSYAKAVQLLNLLIEAAPESADEYKQRGLVFLQTQHLRQSIADLQRYLTLAPDAADRTQIEEQIRTVARWLATLN
jgi:regulator of sirC expression with transglutaminase-like and TPR domain